MRFVLIEGGDIYTPRRAGVQPLLLADGKIARLGPVETTALHALSDEVTTIDATGCIVVPGLIDPHAHIIGAGGEHGFGSNAAAVLKLGAKGNLAPDKDADVLILKQDSLEIMHLFARGRHVICDGKYVEPSRQEQQVESGKE